MAVSRRGLTQYHREPHPRCRRDFHDFREILQFGLFQHNLQIPKRRSVIEFDESVDLESLIVLPIRRQLPELRVILNRGKQFFQF
jgi:hypothetical protein